MTISKEHIIREIIRTTKENGGKPFGQNRFATQTGIKKYDWFGKYWTMWGDALKEAGYEPNMFNQAYDEDLLIRKLIDLIREKGKFPTDGDLKLKANNDKNFPDSHTFIRRLGNKQERVKKVIAYCEKQGQLSDVLEICRPMLISDKEINESEIEIDGDVLNFEFVYMMKSGKFYKIGKSNSVGRREYELGIQLPEKPREIHKIKTDDPRGIENYWHERFKDKRKNGEWFELSGADVKIFKRRKFM